MAIDRRLDGGSGAAGTVVFVLAMAVVGCAAGIAAYIDRVSLRVPNRLSGAIVAVAVVASISATRTVSRPAVAGPAGELAGDVVTGLSLAIAGCLLAGVPMLMVRLRRGIGMGDVKLAGALGASVGALGWWVPLVAIALSSLYAAGTGWATGRSALPLAPFLSAGWLSSLLAAVVWSAR